MEFVVCELDKIKDVYPEFEASAKRLKEAALARAREIWPAFRYGGMFPGPKEFGITTALPKFFKGFAGTTLTTFRQNFTSTGWQDIFNMTVDEDIIIAGMGFAITSPTINVTELRLEIDDMKFPRINIEELRAYRQPAIIFKQGWVAQEERPFLLRGYFEATGYQRIIPVNAFVLYKKKADVISE